MGIEGVPDEMLAVQVVEVCCFDVREIWYRKHHLSVIGQGDRLTLV
jgi:hypothetical protein